MRYRSRLIVGAVCLTAAVSACSSNNTDRPASASQASSGGSGAIKIGISGNLSGALSFSDNEILRGAKLAMADINAKGGVNGRKLQLIEGDDKSDLNLVQPTAQGVLDKGAQVLISACDYDYGGPAARLANKHGVVVVSCAGSPLFGKQGIGDLTFNAMSSTVTEGAVLAQFAHDKGWRRPYLLEDTSLEYSTSLCKYFDGAWKKISNDAPVAGHDTFVNSDSSVASQITRLKRSNADYVVLCSYKPGEVSVIKQLRASGVNLPLLSSIGIEGTEWIKAIPGLNGFYGAADGALTGDDPNVTRTAFYAAYKKAYGQLPQQATQSMAGYTIMQVIAAGIDKAGTTDGAALAKAIETFHEQPFLSGPTSYTSDCHVPLGRPMVIWTVHNGQAGYLADVRPSALAPNPPC